MSTTSYKEKIATRAAREISEGKVVNFGIGIPTLIAKFLPPEIQFFVHAENGVLGMGGRCPRGQEDRNLIDAGGAYVELVPGASFFDSALSFAMIRGGRLDVAFLGALEVSAKGDLANWIIPGKYAPGIGGAMEVAQKARRLIVVTNHNDRAGNPKVVEECSLPLTGKACVDLIITEIAVMQPTRRGLLLLEIAEEVELEEVRQRTGVELLLPPEGPARF
ncbi:3-oxoacid CoA-transferase subunit B [Desulfoferula mesophila]|uniref:Acyl CoA:acetate/3-ketoacid CoA transferase subunit beta n=1 Tax=Desulfoferula mesophila TaxID=3058419 RepID=A0AAU9EEQ0_9BACT|nr:acyl CoA:acetate/3-ketoacid CoA transferase subunit beta [Desulfoferula mesophilus]